MRRLGRSILSGCFALVLITFSIIGYESYCLLTRPMVTAGSQPFIVVIDKNTSAFSLAHILKSNRLIQSERLFLFLIRVQGLAYRLKAGVYEIMPGESVQEFINKVASGKVLTKAFRIIEGSNFNQVKTNLKKAPLLNYNLEDWQAIASDYPTPEGLLLADTYNYDAGSSSKQLLLLANQKLLDYLDHCWKNRSQRLPYKSPYELLTAASILEKETAISEERKIISGVIINRLKKNMPLQMDPTVIYALGINYHGKLTHADLSVDSPYNTYRYRGLPPTPIAMVGKESIEAAAHPQISDYLYFVAKGDGSHQFSVNYEQQKQAISRYQKKDI
ncbi:MULTISPECIES: endolytic transglycosylase MltG [unclassified Legionella]|uniref:endolytic transglycosylase MltG n=1 Tax=unclassified Legionella TaxID=2622702 RepID=UPI001055F3BE|nr:MULTISPECIES: endolytic transglycosylase MltG [unclassified Legionella]MDI9818198.1 endolytic transglycosylase MltG [Legionella sp. PL877]